MIRSLPWISRLLLGAMLLIVLPSPTTANPASTPDPRQRTDPHQRSQLDREYRAYRTAIGSHDYERAFVHARAALEIGQGLFGSPHETTAVLRINLGDIEMLRARYEQARPHYERALESLTTLKGDHDLALLIPLNDLARIHTQAGYFDRARSMHEHALRIVEQTYGEQHPAVANRLVTLGIFEELTRELDSARSRYERSLRIRQQLFPETHPDVAESWFFLAKLELQSARYAEALPLYERALDVFEKSPPRDPKIVTAARRQHAIAARKLGTSAAASTPIPSELPHEAAAQPIVRSAPEYPRSALRRGVEGSVRLGFRIGADGRVYDARVLESDPPRIFDRAALEAIARWEYQPRMREGRPVETPSTEVVLRFVLPK